MNQNINIINNLSITFLEAFGNEMPSEAQISLMEEMIARCLLQQSKEALVGIVARASDLQRGEML